MGDHDTRDALLGGVSGGLSLLGAMTGNATLGSGATAARGALGMGQQMASDDANVWSATGSAATMLSGVARLANMPGTGALLSGAGSTLGVANGLVGIADPTATLEDRYTSAAGAIGSGLSLAGNILTMGEYSTAALLGTDVAAIGGTGTAAVGTTLGAGGAVVASGVGGYGVGTAMREGAASDEGRDRIFGNNVNDTASGRGFSADAAPVADNDRTAMEAWTDFCADNIGNPIDNMAWRQAQDIRDTGDALDRNIDALMGSDTAGDSTSAAMDWVADAYGTVVGGGGHVLGGLATAVGALPATLAGDAVALDNWFD